MAAALRMVLALITLGCVYLFVAHPLWFPAGVSAESVALDRNFAVAFRVLGALFIAGQLVLALVLMRRPATAESKHWYGNWRIEIAWTAAITVIFFWFNISGGRLWSHEIAPHSAAGATQVEVTGAQFQWYFRYPGADGTFGRTDAPRWAKADEGNPLGIDPGDPAGRDDIVATQMVVPVGHTVELQLRAQDVIHSLFIPAMRFKQDAVPGMDIHTHFTPVKVGVYEIACAELCGIGHYRMRALVRVVSEEEFAQWLKGQANR
ncbi:MAG TPA: cytochrome C oxidase subunit II [Candidatus Angelobacter sp.]|nr:cytochrome C oxidase subunit II [Candidatus Angelobacter sp.]